MVTESRKARPRAGRVPGVREHEGALPADLFERLVRAVRAIGDERIERNYTTTFWFELGSEPTNVAEECVVELMRWADPDPSCIGIEWWIGRLRRGAKLRLHFDRDMTLRKRTGAFVHPLRGSVLYLNRFPGAPTVILDQIPGPDGESRVPEKARIRQAVDAVPNRYVVFPGNLRHGVVPDRESKLPAVDDEFRLTFLVNYWDRRPLPPICFDYDGTIYPSLCDRKGREHGAPATR